MTQPLVLPAGLGTFPSYDQALTAAVAAYWANRPRRRSFDDVEVPDDES